jgi:cold shock CspA family protein
MHRSNVALAVWRYGSGFLMSYSRGGGDAPRLTTRVKWFSRTKGFGFVAANDGTGDAFLPAGILAQAGYDEIAEGTTLVCEAVEGTEGLAAAAKPRASS